MVVISLVVLAVSVGPLLSCRSAEATITHKYVSQLIGFTQVNALAAGGAGEVYVANRAEGGIQTVDRFNSSGTPLPFTCGPECSGYVEGSKLTGTPGGPFEGNLVGLAVDDETKAVYVADGNEHVVDVFSSTGKYEGQLSGTCANAGESPPSCPTFVPFENPKGLTVDQTTHDLYVAEANGAIVDVFEPEAGGKAKYLSRFGAGVLSFPTSVAVNEHTRNAYVGEEDPGLIDVFEASGAFVPPAWEGEGTPNKAFGGQVHLGVDSSTHHEYGSTGDEVDEFAESVTEEYLGHVTGTPTGGGGLFVPLSSAGAVAVAPSTAPTKEDLYVASTEAGEVVVDQFGPDVVIPDVTASAASQVRLGSVVLNGTVNPTAEGGEATCGFEYGTSTSYGKTVGCEGPGSSATPVPKGSAPVAVKSEPVSGLALDTIYYYRLDATNKENGETNDGECPEDCGQFISAGPGLHGESVTDVTSTSATLQASINPNKAPADATRTSYYFQYGTESTAGCTSSTCTSVPAAPGEAIGPAEEDLEVSQEAQPLDPSTVYYYRLVVLSELEVAAGKFETEVFDEPERTFTTQSVGSEFELPDGRQWEMVSPPDKHGAGIEPMLYEGGVIQAAEGGGAITYVASGPVVSDPPGNRSLEDTQVLSRRGPAGWGSEDIVTPTNAVGLPFVGSLTEYKWFSPDLSQGLVEPRSGTPLPPLEAGAERTIYLRHNNECEPTLTESVPVTCYQALATAANTLPGAKLHTGSNGGESIEFEGASPDLNHVVFSSREPLTLGAAAGPENLYEWVAGKLALVSVLPRTPEEEEKGEAARSASEEGVAAVLGYRASETSVVRGAVSTEGSWVIWTAGVGGPSVHLYSRDMETGETVQLDVPEAGLPGGGEPKFRAASSDGSRVFFTDTVPLTAGAPSNALYVCEMVVEGGRSKCRLTELAAGIGNLVTGASEDGSYLYFGSGGKMEVAQESAGKWTTSVIATLSGEDVPDSGSSNANATYLTSRVSPNGRYLAFMSSASLTGYDNLDVKPGAYKHERINGHMEVVYEDGRPVPARDEEVYLYDAASGKLVCASCDPTGARPTGVYDPGTDSSSEAPLLVDEPAVWEGRWLAGSVPGWTPVSAEKAFYQSRYLSDSGRLFFDSPEALVPADVNGKENVYEYEPEGVGPSGARCSSLTGGVGEVFKPAHADDVEGQSSEEPAGCVGLISSGTSAQESVFLDASGMGPGGEDEEAEDVFFLTTSQLVKADQDTGYDVYDAHVCSAVSPCPSTEVVAPLACTSVESTSPEACRAPALAQPSIFGAPASATFSGVGNLAPAAPVVPLAKPKTAAQIKAEKLAKGLKACRKDKRKTKRKSCEASVRKKYGAARKATKSDRRVK